MNEASIALLFDFDETLGPDTIGFLLSHHTISEEIFWQEVSKKVNDSWDPPLAYMSLLLEYANSGKIDLSKKALQKLGNKMALFPGLPKAFAELKDFVKKEQVLKDARIQLEFYIISGGLEEMIIGSKLGSMIDGIFGSAFAYDAITKKASGIRSAISFTEKTRYLYGINKGVGVSELRTNPYKINDAMPNEQKRIPFSQMIYIGDGPSDIPCLSAVTQYGGTGIGVSSPHKTFKKGYELARGKRITVGPYTANYNPGTDMRKVLEETILSIGLEISINRKKQVVTAPKVG